MAKRLSDRGMFRRGSVEHTADLARILALPRRPADLQILTDELTLALRQEGGTMSLRPAQALALFELAELGGLFAPIKCGGGKTLVSLLAARMFPHVRRPVLLIPSALKEKTARDAAALSRHFWIWLPRMIGYQSLARKGQVYELEHLNPDMVIADESHFLANLENASVARRLARFLSRRPDCIYVDMSGTGIGTDLRKYQHRLAWTHAERSPLPLVRAETERWQAAVYPTDPNRAVGVGALSVFGANPGPGLVRWIRDTPGVVGTEDVGCGANILYSLWRPDMPQALRALIDQVRLEERRPDGVDLLDDFAGVAQTISQLALGFWYKWDPPAPEPWLAARKRWWKFVREVLAAHELDADGTPLDTELQVRLAYPKQAAEWSALRPTFAPNPVAVWETRSIAEQAADWAHSKVKRDAGIVWVRYRAIGEALEKCGLPYFGRDATHAKTGTHVEHASGPIAASIRSCGTGQNLQQYRRNLVLNLPADAGAWEQLISRTHREGQQADCVDVAIIRSVPEHAKTLRAARDMADTLTAQGDRQRLSIGDWVD